MVGKPEVFIIESLDLKDEQQKRFEGRILSDMLNLHEKNSIYYYIRTKREFEEILDEFYEADYRYLHISCHGNEEIMGTTFDCITFQELGDLLKGVAEDRRIFLSACSMTNLQLANEIIPKSRCLSILGPSMDFDFDDLAVFWTSFYHLMFKHNSRGMNKDIVLDTADKLATILGIQLNYFGRKTNNQVSQIGLPRNINIQT